MFELSSKLVLDAEAIASPNLCDRFSAEDLDKIGNHVWEGFDRDKRSRLKWEKRTQAAMDLAMQVQKAKNFPWPNCSNIAFPLITIGALNFHSRAYPALISGVDVVRCRVIGQDLSGNKTKRANRISTHMSWQVLEEDRAWEEQKDRLLINLPIVGTVFTKSYWNAKLGHRVDETVLAQDLVLDYFAKSVESCPRKTHIIPFFRNDIHANIKRKTFRDITGEKWYGEPAPLQNQATVNPQRDNRLGMTPPPEGDETTPYLGLEQHVDLDLDQDGYAEPYIITIEETSKCVLRIVTGFDQEADVERNKQGEAIAVRRMEYFTKYSFIPSPDGGIYDVGFGVLLGPLNESVNTTINQLTDAGTMQTTKGGFLGKGAKIRGGVYTMSPFTWARVDSSGDDLRKNLVPHETGEPSTVLFQLLGLLINYVERISGTTDPQVGENPGQNTPAETMRTMVQEGQRVYSAVFKRVWRSMKEEFRKGFILNGIYMPTRKSFGEGQMALREDYLGNPDEVAPAADPNITSDQMQIIQAQLLKQAAGTTAGYDADAVERRYLKALKVESVDEIFPGMAKTGAPKDVRVQIQELKNEQAQAELQVYQQETVIRLQEERRVNDSQILKVQADIILTQEELKGDVRDRQVAMLNAALGFAKQRNEHITKQLDVLIKQLDVRKAAIEVGMKAAKAKEAADAQQGTTDGGTVRRLAPASGNRGSKEGTGEKAA